MERIKQALGEARQRRQALPECSQMLIDSSQTEHAPKSASVRYKSRHYMNQNTMLILGAVTVIAINSLVWWLGSDEPTHSISLSALEAEIETDMGERISMSTESQARDSAYEEFKQDIESLNVRVDTLTDSIDRIEKTVQRMYVRVNVMTDSTVAGATDTGVTHTETTDAEAADTGTAMSEGEQQVAAILTTQSDTGEDLRGISAKQKSTLVKERGPWVINLASFPTKAAADRFAESAQSKGIQTEQTRVIVKGKEYWRIQLTNFPTAKEARSYAGSVKEKLGLKEIWISRR